MNKFIKNIIMVNPMIEAETDGTVRNQESTKSERVTQQKIPHHQFAVAHIKGASAAGPQFGFFFYYRSLHLLFVKGVLQK